MRWSPTMISRLTRVRDVRLRLAEMELALADQELTASRQAEEHARRELAGTAERTAVETAEANAALLENTAGGRQGIAEWQVTRKRARVDLQRAQGAVDEAVGTRLGKELDCSTARARWRDLRLDVERLQLLAERLAESPA